MNLSKSFSLALAALVLVVLAGASSANAQTVTFNLGTAPTFVANTGRSEVLGQVTLTADVICAVAADGLCVSTAGTLQVLYAGTPIDNTAATGITITDGTVGAAYVVAGSTTVTNTTAGGVVSFAVNGAVDFIAGEQITISGVRGQIDLSPAAVVGTAILGQLTASPSTIASFNPTQEVVARSADPLTIAFGPWTVLQCRPGIGAGTVTVSEGFNTAFVDHDGAGDTTTPAPGTANARPLFGGNSNSHVHIVLTGLPSGVTITWPALSAVDSGTGATTAVLQLLAGSVTGNGATVTYVFSTPNQAASDVSGEIFVINLTAAANIGLSGTPNDFGTVAGQGQMYPPVTPTGARPRYNHPLEPVPAATWLTIAPCTTNLLFPWVINVNPGLDTGIAIANTSADPYGTVGQTGACTLNLYPTSLTTGEGVSAGAAIPMTTQAVQPGSVWRAAMSGTTAFAGVAGYIIAVCNFQYGHGFAYITDNFGVGAPNTAQGYLALLIPDPKILGGITAASNCGTVNNPAGNFRSAANGAADQISAAVGAGAACAPPYGEGLAQ